MSNRRRSRDFGVDANGRPTATMEVNGQSVVVHYGDMPESDITTVHGLRCTTVLRTMIDIAPNAEPERYRAAVDDCLARRRFTLEEALARLDQPDMATYRGALLLRAVLTARASR